MPNIAAIERCNLDDYESAALRHFADAKTLNAAGRLDNAGHLIGFAAECAIKHQLSNLSQPQEVSIHFPALLLAARKHLGARSNYSVSMFQVIKEELFTGWIVNRRYHVTGHTTVEEMALWINQTQRLFACANLKAHV
jgi:hypothetical protein